MKFLPLVVLLVGCSPTSPTHDSSAKPADPIVELAAGSTCFVDKLADERQHLLLTNASNKSVNSLLAEVDIILLVALACKALLGSQPLCVNVLIDINHELEDLIQDVLDQFIVFSRKGGLSLEHGCGELKRLMADSGIGKVLFANDWLELGIDVFEGSSEEVWLDLGELIELDESLLEDSLIIFVESLDDYSSHERQELGEVLGIFALGARQEVCDSL